MRTLTDRIRTLSEEELKELHKVYASTKLKDRSYIGCLLQAKPRPGGFVEAMQTEIKRLDEKNQRAAKFRPPHWPPVISLLERERRKKLRRELERAQKQPQATTSSRPPPREKKAKSHSDARPSTSKWPPVLKGLSTPALPPSASLAILPPTPAVAQLAMERVPRATQWRRKKRMEEDRKSLEETGKIRRRRDPSCYPCKLCGQPKRLEFGHSYYKGKSFCSKASGRSAADWLSEQKRLAGV
ncbi:hypothetical protein AMEX_G6081, partial [Astyanax mexicanus]